MNNLSKEESYYLSDNVRNNDFEALDNYADSRDQWKAKILNKHYLVILIGKCPFHKDDVGTGTYNPWEDSFKCLSCGENGNGFKLATGIANEQSNME